MTMIAPLASTLPEHSNDGYVAAAYIVFLAIVLIYVAIMAIRLSRVERDLRELRTRAEQDPHTEQPGRAETHERTPARERERETV